MTTNTLAAIRERADKRTLAMAYEDRAALLAIVDALTARAEAAEAANERVHADHLRQGVELQDLRDKQRWDAARIQELEAALREIADFKAVRVPGTGVTLYVTAFDRVQQIAADALAACAANGESAGNGGA